MALNDNQWEQLCGHREIMFARTTPEQKLRIVRDFQARDEIVGMAGEGVNDAHRLRLPMLVLLLRPAPIFPWRQYLMVLLGEAGGWMRRGILKGFRVNPWPAQTRSMSAMEATVYSAPSQSVGVGLRECKEM
jgi:hypothetical protein